MIDQYRRRPAVDDGIGRGDHGEGRDDHLVARLQPQRGQGQMHCDGAVGAGNAVLGFAGLSKVGLEFTDEAACRRDPVGLYGLLHVLHLVAGQGRFADRDDGATLIVIKAGNGLVADANFRVGGRDDLGQIAHIFQGKVAGFSMLRVLQIQV